jgi:hypothetical protein
MAYNKHNTDIVTAVMNNLSHVDGTNAGRPPDGPDGPDETCTCITTTILSGFLTCTRCPNPRPDDQFSNLRSQPIKTFSFTGSFTQAAECGDGNSDIPKPGDTYTSTMTEGGSEEECHWEMTSISEQNKGDCECCGAIWVHGETLHIESIFAGECTPYGQQGPDDRRWDWDGQGAELLFHSLMREVKSQIIAMHQLKCCNTGETDRSGAGQPNNIVDSLPIEDMARSFQLAWDGQNSEIRGHKMNDSVIIKPKSTPTTGTNRGRFVLKGSAGLIQYYKGDVVTFAGKTYSVLEDVKGKHPSNDSSFLLIEDKNSGVDGGIY